MNAYEYSEKEIQLFKKLNLDYLLDNPHCPPPMVYTTATYHCFMNYEDIDKNLHNSIKKCMKEWENQKNGIKRLTKEWDNLICLD